MQGVPISSWTLHTSSTAGASIDRTARGAPARMWGHRRLPAQPPRSICKDYGGTRICQHNRERSGDAGTRTAGARASVSITARGSTARTAAAAASAPTIANAWPPSFTREIVSFFRCNISGSARARTLFSVPECIYRAFTCNKVCVLRASADSCCSLIQHGSCAQQLEVAACAELLNF